MISLDTNIAVYAFEPSDKQGAALAILSRRPVLSVQVLNEYMNVVRRKRRRAWAEISNDLEDLRALAMRVAPITDDANRRAIKLASRYQLAPYDSVLLAVALENDVRTLYSEDMHHDLLIDGTLRIVDPFR